MKKLKLFFALFAMLALGVGNAWGAEVTYTFNTDAGIAELGVTKPSAGAGTDLDADKSYVLGDVSMKVTHATTKTRVYNSSGKIDLRIYKNGGTLTFSVPSGSISKVVFAGTTTDVFTANVGTLSNSTWTGDAASVTFTATATGKINTITVTYETASGENPGEGGGDPEEPTPGTGGEASTVTFTYADLKGQGASGSGADFTGATKDPIFMGGKGHGNTSYVQIYANNYLTFTPTNATITKIVLTATSDYIKTWSASEGTIEVSGDKATWTGSSTSTITLTNTASAQARITQMDVTYTASGSDEPEAEIVKTLKSIAVSDMTTIYEQGSEFSFDGTCTATYSVTKDGAAQADQTAKVEPTSVSTPDMNQLGTQTVTVTYTEGEVTKTADYTITIEEAPTYDFRKIDMSKWGTGYDKRVVTYEDATVTFASASKQSGTITDQPVTKGGEVSLVLTDGMNIATVKWVCTQWTTKTQTITLHYSKDGGNVYTSTEIESSDFTISSDNLPAGTNAVKITFSSTSNQVGIKSCTITKVEAAAITQVPAPQFSLQGGAYDGAQSVELTCTMADATIHYTTDGTTPTTTSPVYSTAIQVAESMTIKAYAVKEGLEDSPVVEATYEISAPADVVLDFTTNDTWNFPTEKTVTATDYSNGDYTVTVAGSEGQGFMFDNTNKNLMIGKEGSYIVLPIFNKPIVKIVCEGVSSGSGSVTFNVFVDDEPVSTAVTSCKVDQTFLIAEDNQVANVAHVIKVTNAQNVRFSKIKIYLGEAPAVERPVIAGKEEFAGSTEVSITCATSGAKIYYTTDGTTPTDASPEYTTPFELTETKTVKAIAYVDGQASAVATKTFTKQELVNVATAMALAKDEIAYFDEFEVVKKVEGKGYIYIKDASGHGLIFDYDLESALKDGDRVKGFVGISSPYNNLPEMKPYNVTATDLTITSGTAAEPYDFSSTAIAAEHMNKYVVFKGVEMTEDVDITSHPTLIIGGNSVYLRNQFGKSVTLTSGVKYDIYAFVAIYNTTLQYYFYQANKEGEASVKYTVTYNAGGATGTVPVDNNQYAAGDQVYLESALSLSYEGYEYKGWKVTDVNGNEILVSNNRFNMPASNVTVTAQWEEIVVTPKEDFSAGLWVLVTDMNELAADDYIIVAAAEENFAMKSYESGNNCKQVAITKFGNNNCFLTWTEEIGVFQLLASGSNYTIQDVNTKQYLYAAGTGTSNHLKASTDIATNENASKYVWTIAVDENGIATVKATSENRNTLMYNTGSDLFSCYASGQKDIVLYKYVTDFYTRDVVTTGNLGTICLPYASSKHAGATFYEIAYLEMNGTDPNRIYLDEVEGGVLEAGKPYIFQATSNKVTVAYEGEASSLKEGVKGLVGILEDSKVVIGQEGVSNILTGNYVISGTKFYTCGTGCSIYKNRAYIDASIIANHTTPVAEMPGRRRIAMGAAGENQATGVDNTLAPQDNVVKVIENGQLIIIRDGVKYNVQGQKL